MRRLIGACLLAALLAGCGGQRAPAGVSLRVSAAPFRITVLLDGKPVAAEDAGARLRFELDGKGVEYALTHELSHRGGSYRVATSEPGRSALVTVSSTACGSAEGASAAALPDLPLKSSVAASDEVNCVSR